MSNISTGLTISDVSVILYCKTPVLGLGLGVDFTFVWDNKNDNNKKSPHLSVSKGTVLGDKEHGVVIRNKG